MASKYRSALFVLALSSASTALSVTPPHQTHKREILIVAVSRDASLLTGGIEGPSNLAGNKVQLGIVGMLKPDGKIRKVLCDSDDQSECSAIESRYLSRPTTYRTISLSRGRVVTSIPTKVSDCYETSGMGTLRLRNVQTALGATDTSAFGLVNAVGKVTSEQRRLLQVAASELIARQSASLPVLSLNRFESVRLDGKSEVLLIAEGSSLAEKSYSMFFGVWRTMAGNYQLLLSNVASGFEEPENYIGTIRLRRESSDYIVTSTRNSEGYRFNMYALRHDHLVRVFQGGGGGC